MAGRPKAQRIQAGMHGASRPQRSVLGEWRESSKGTNPWKHPNGPQGSKPWLRSPLTTCRLGSAKAPGFQLKHRHTRFRSIRVNGFPGAGTTGDDGPDGPDGTSAAPPTGTRNASVATQS